MKNFPEAPNFHELQLVESNANKNRALAPFTFLFIWAKAQIHHPIGNCYIFILCLLQSCMAP